MVVAVITARVNSRGLPGKNMLDLGGRPLIAHSMEIASATAGFDRVILSTDMDAAIALAAQFPRVEVPFIRPAELCTDTATHLAVINHLLDYLEQAGTPATHVVLLQPTTPFRTVAEMVEGVRLLKAGAGSVLGVTEVMHHPADYVYKNAAGKTTFLMPEFKSIRRQEFPQVYINNGAFYGVSVPFFREKQDFYDEDCAFLKMGEHSLIDIDTPFDMILARAVAAHILETK